MLPRAGRDDSTLDSCRFHVNVAVLQARPSRPGQWSRPTLDETGALCCREGAQAQLIASGRRDLAQFRREGISGVATGEGVGPSMIVRRTRGRTWSEWKVPLLSEP